MKKISILIMLFLLCFSSMIVFVPSVIGATGDVTLADWSGLPLGSSSGIEDYIDFERTGGTGFLVSNDWFHSDDRCLKVTGITGDEGYINNTESYSYIHSITFWMKFYLGNAGINNERCDYTMEFRNSSGVPVLKFHLKSIETTGVQTNFWIYDEGGVARDLITITRNVWYTYKIVVTHKNTNLMNYSVYNETGVLKGFLEDGAYTSADWDSFSTIFIDTVTVVNGAVTVYLDDIAINTNLPEFEEGTETQGTSFYLNFYDVSTGKPLAYISKTSGYTFTTGLYDTFNCNLISTVSLWSGDYGGISTGLTYEINTNFTEGKTYTFYLTDNLTTLKNFYYRIYSDLLNYKIYIMKHKTFSLKLYSGQTYGIYLEPISYVDGVEYPNCGVDLTGWGAYCCLNKQEYSIGETLRLEYKLPPESWLNSNNYDVTGYQLKVYNTQDYLVGVRFRTGLLKTPYILAYNQTDGEIILDGNRHTLEINILQDINEYGFDDFFNKYEIAIETEEWGLFKSHSLVKQCYFYVNGLTYLPNGTINSITPNPCYMGQEVSIAWQSNGNGYIEICYPNGHVYYRQPYGYSSGAHTLTKTITAIGTLAVNLYTNSLLYNNTLPVDTATLTCTPLGTNGTYGSYGYGVPYLYIPSYRGIAGYDTIYIYYRTYKNDSIFNVMSPRQEQTFFSTTVSNQSDNVLAIPLEPYMQIGVWNVTLTGGDISGNDVVLSSSFNIVNEEGNWIEFTKNVYNTNEVFSLFIKHTYRISLTFYKDDIAQGESLIYEINENDNTIVNIEKSLIALTSGNWRVEMYRINDRNIVELLAEDICMVEYSKAIAEPLNIDFIGVIPAPIKLLIGIIIPVIFALIPLLVIASLSRKGKDVDNLELICVAFFFFGMFISIMLSFLPVASIFIVLFGVIVTFALMYVQRKEG